MEFHEQLIKAIKDAGVMADGVSQWTVVFGKDGVLVSVSPNKLLNCPECGGQGIKVNRSTFYRFTGFCDFCAGSGKVSAQDMSNHNHISWADLLKQADEVASREPSVEVDDIPF